MKKRLPMFLVFVLSIFLLLLNTHQNFLQTKPEKEVKKPSLAYSWQIFNSTSWQIDKATPNNEQTYLVAKAIHYKNKTKESQFTEPFSIQQKPDSLLVVQSQQGTSQNDQVIHLSGKVRIDSFSLTQQKNKTLKSEQITYNSQTESLVSPVFTKLITPKTIITGTGFSANLKQDQYNFKSNVKTLYQPDQSTP